MRRLLDRETLIPRDPYPAPRADEDVYTPSRDAPPEGLMERLDPRDFLRVHRSHAVNIRVVRELRPQVHGEYVMILDDGTELSSGRSFRSRIQQAFGLSRQAIED